MHDIFMSVVQDYLDERDAWIERMRTGASEGGGPPSMRKRPSVVRAVAAGRAILDAEGVHEKTVAAAEFLVDHAWDVPRGDWHGAAGARALATHAPPDYEGWPRVLDALDMAPCPSGTWVPVSPIDEFFAETASNADNPVLRAAAQYHLAAGLMREAKRSTMSSSEQDHAARRERALQQAKGLSADVENETFDDSMRRGGDEMPRTFAQAEAHRDHQASWLNRFPPRSRTPPVEEDSHDEDQADGADRGRGFPSMPYASPSPGR